MKKYQQLAQQLTEQIALGVWQPGDRLPSLREQVVSSGMSFMTVSHAYQLLESQGRIIARPQSGYYVAPRPVKSRQPAPPAQVTRHESVDINTYIFEVLQASRQASMLPFASAFPDPRLFPLQQLIGVADRHETHSAADHLLTQRGQAVAGLPDAERNLFGQRLCQLLVLFHR